MSILENIQDHFGWKTPKNPGDYTAEIGKLRSAGLAKGGFIHGIGHYQDGGFVDPHNNSRRLMNQARRRYVRSS